MLLGLLSRGRNSLSATLSTAAISVHRPSVHISATAATAASARPSKMLLSTSPTHRSFSSYLVSPRQLSEALKANPTSPLAAEPRVIPLSVAWFLPNDGRKGIDTFLEKRIPKARFFDLDKVVEKHSEYPHMLPSGKELATTMSELGIRIDDTVVVYDTAELGIFSAPRVAWTLRVCGHKKVHILDNFRQWVAEGLPTESGEFYPVDVCTYPIPKKDDSRVATFEYMKQVAAEHGVEGTETAGVQVIDARGPGRWSGREPEPREGMSSGHMPGSINIPFGQVLDPETKNFLPKEKLRELFVSKGLDPDRPIVATCGSGVTACVLETALELAQFGKQENRRVYDGSWVEYAQRIKSSEGLIVKTEETQIKEESKKTEAACA